MKAEMSLSNFSLADFFFIAVAICCYRPLSQTAKIERCVSVGTVKLTKSRHFRSSVSIKHGNLNAIQYCLMRGNVMEVADK
jgi:uncharacterized protein involved in response to NO